MRSADILKIGPLGAIDLKYLINDVGLLEEVSLTELKIVGRKFNPHDVRLNRLLDAYYSPTKLVLEKAFFSTSLDDVQKIIESQPGHPHYLLNRAQFGFYRFIGGVVKLYTYNEVIWALVGLVAFLVLWFFKLPSPLLYWWVIQAVYGLSWRGLSQFEVLSWSWTKNTFWDNVSSTTLYHVSLILVWHGAFASCLCRFVFCCGSRCVGVYGLGVFNKTSYP